MTGQVISKKLMLLGEIGVGKTSLIRRFVLNEFNFDYRPTMGVDIYRQRVTGLGPAGNQTVELAGGALRLGKVPVVRYPFELENAVAAE